MEDRRKSKRRSSPSITRFLRHIQHVFKPEEMQRFFVRLKKN
jgi:hypothetical protein